MTPEALAGLHEVLLQAALRAERGRIDATADARAVEIAKRCDQRAQEARK
jgi:hypothetical protein